MDTIRIFGLSCVVSIVALFLNLIQMHFEDSGQHPILERILVIPIFLLFFISIPSTAVLFFLIHQYNKRHERIVLKDEHEKQARLDAINDRLLKHAEEERDYLKNKCASIERSYNRLNNSTGSTMPPIDYDDYPVFYSEDYDM